MSAPANDSERDEREPTPEQAAAVNKWIAVWAYCHGYASEATTRKRFAVHPEWGAA